MRFLIVLLFLCSSCSEFYGLPKDQKMAYKVMKQYVIANHQDHNKAVGLGLVKDRNSKKIGALSISIALNDSLTIESARKCAIYFVNDFVNYINNQTTLQSSLAIFPISPDQVDIMILGRDRLDDNPEYVHMVNVYEGKVIYFNESVLPPNVGLIHKESYLEALSKLQSQ